MSALMRFIPIPKRPTVGSAVANLHGSRPIISHYVTRAGRALVANSNRLTGKCR